MEAIHDCVNVENISTKMAEGVRCRSFQRVLFGGCSGIMSQSVSVFQPLKFILISVDYMRRI